MDEQYEFHPSDFAVMPGTEISLDAKRCPDNHCFCPHYVSAVCDVKYRECVLLNSLKTSETLLQAEREKLLKNPTSQNLALIAQINDILRNTGIDMHIDPKAIVWNRRKGQAVAALLFALICAAAIMIYLG